MNDLVEEQTIDFPTLYTSLLLPSPRSRQARSDLSNPYELHRTLSRAFPELPAPPNEPGDAAAQQAADEARRGVRCLFRIEETKRGLAVLAQSRVAPDWDAISVAHPDYFIVAPEVKVWTPHFTNGQRFAFRLRANPTVKREGKRRALLSEQDRLRWLARQAEEYGFTLPLLPAAEGDPLPNVHLSDERIHQGKTARGLTVIHNAVSFDGVLRVADPASFLEAVTGGIGPAKGFGFGLLSLARA